jgi:hypothetical protein
MPKCCDCDNEAMVGTNKKTGLPYKRCKACADKAREGWRNMIQEAAAAKKRTVERFAELWGAAQQAGAMAGAACTPTPMLVGSPSTPLGNDIDPTKRTYFVPDGVCGFASVTVSPANCQFANWLRNHYYREENGQFRGYDPYSQYHKAVMISVHEYNQSMTRKEAHAHAVAKYLNEHLDELKGTGKTTPRISVWSRMD